MIFFFFFSRASSLEPTAKAAEWPQNKNRAKTGKRGQHFVSCPSLNLHDSEERRSSCPETSRECTGWDVSGLDAGLGSVDQAANLSACARDLKVVFGLCQAELQVSIFRILLRVLPPVSSALVPRCFLLNQHSGKHRQGLSLSLASILLPTLIRILWCSSRPSRASRSSFTPHQLQTTKNRATTTPSAPHDFLNMKKIARDPADPVESS